MLPITKPGGIQVSEQNPLVLLVESPTGRMVNGSIPRMVHQILMLVTYSSGARCTSSCEQLMENSTVVVCFGDNQSSGHLKLEFQAP